MALASENHILSNVCDYFCKKPKEEQMNLLQVIDYINEHAAGGDGEPSVYVGTYAKYNSGSLYGMWVSITSFNDYEEFLEFCAALHGDEECPEFMYQDYEYFPKSWYSESGLGDSFDKILWFAQCEDREAAMVYIDSLGRNDVDGFEDAYKGKWDSEVEFARNLFEELYEDELPEFACTYFDMEAFARDLFISDYTYVDGHVFCLNA